LSRAINHLDHRFVTFIPNDLEDGIIYVSIQYKTVTHKCCCGCGEKVVTPLSPAGWALTFDGSSVSLSDSIAGGRCKSHYFIRQGKVQWARPLSGAQMAAATRRDQHAVQRIYGPAPINIAAAAPQSPTWWYRLWRRLIPKRPRNG
jgi:hypothetical protein